MTSTLPVSAPVETPTSARDARVDRFLARVAGLSPREWGELDAIGQRFDASDPIAWWRRGRTFAAVASRVPVLEDAMSVVAFVIYGADDIASAFRRRPARLPTVVSRVPEHASPESRRMARAVETLLDVARVQPGGPGEAIHCLLAGLTALWVRDHLTADGFARMYELVEPVIPASSL